MERLPAADCKMHVELFDVTRDLWAGNLADFDTRLIARTLLPPTRARNSVPADPAGQERGTPDRPGEPERPRDPTPDSRDHPAPSRAEPGKMKSGWTLKRAGYAHPCRTAGPPEPEQRAPTRETRTQWGADSDGTYHKRAAITPTSGRSGEPEQRLPLKWFSEHSGHGSPNTTLRVPRYQSARPIRAGRNIAEHQRNPGPPGRSAFRSASKSSANFGSA